MYRMSIELSVSDLEIISSDVFETQIHIKSSKNGSHISLPENITIVEENGELSIRETFKDGLSLKTLGKFLTGENNSVYMKIEIPENQRVDHAYMSLKAGDLRLKNIKFGTVDIKSLAGDVKANGISAETFRAALMAGDLKVKGSFHDVDIDVKAGDVKLSPSDAVQTINIHAAVGDTRLELPNIAEYALFSSLGMGELKFKGFTAPVHYDEQSEKKIVVKSKVGDLKIYQSF